MAVYLQIEFIRNKDLGLDRENLVYLSQEGALQDQYDIVRQELLSRPEIETVSSTSSSPLSVRGSTSSVTWEGMSPEEEYEISILTADYDFVRNDENGPGFRAFILARIRKRSPWLRD